MKQGLGHLHENVEQRRVGSWVRLRAVGRSCKRSPRVIAPAQRTLSWEVELTVAREDGAEAAVGPALVRADQRGRGHAARGQVRG